MIHSGSRNLGKQVADHYNKIAKAKNELWFSEVPKSWDLSFLPISDVDGISYYKEMTYCVEFALANRTLMMSRVLEAIQEVMGTSMTVNADKTINMAHNYAAWENHFGANVLVHRKGATRAYVGELGIIPGSMGTSSYIVEGLGNRESFQSCSHGAGRKMGRRVANDTLDLIKEQKILNDQGILHEMDATRLDEAPSAYKDIDEVMELQKDLVKIKIKLRPLAVIKG